MTTLMLIDGNSLTYRAFFALPTDMATASGQVTNAVFGFTSMLVNLLRDHRPDHIAVVFDRPEPTFRHEAVDTYKANRTAAPDILRQQMGLVRQVVEVLQHPGPRAGGLRGRRPHRHGGHRGRRAGPTTCSSSPATATATSWSPTRTSGCSTTAAACPTTPSTTRPASSSAPASRRPSTSSTPRCAAIRPTTCRACPGWGRRRRPSSSPPTAASTASTPTSTR